jgi:hypothetical protein
MKVASDGIVWVWPDTHRRGLVMAGQDGADIPCRLDGIARRRQADAGPARYGRLFQRRVAEDDRRLLAMGGQGLAQPGQLLMRQFDS